MMVFLVGNFLHKYNEKLHAATKSLIIIVKDQSLTLKRPESLRFFLAFFLIDFVNSLTAMNLSIVDSLPFS